MKRRLRGRYAALAAGAVAALVVAGTAYAVTQIETVRATSAQETLPAHQFSPEVLIWTQKPSPSSPASANDVWAKVGSTTPFQLNTQGSAFSGDISGSTVVYQHIVNGSSDIAFKNVLTRKVLPTPAGINTSAGLERHPSMVGDMNTGWLLFDRHHLDNEQILLYSFASHASLLLASGQTAKINPGQVNGPDSLGRYYATWTICQFTCDVHAYRFTPNQFAQGLGARDTVNHLEQDRTRKGPAVSKDGVITFVESGTSCGDNAVIDQVRFAPGTGLAPTQVVALPANKDSDHTYVSRNPANGADWVYFHMATCGGNSNLYRVALPALPT